MPCHLYNHGHPLRGNDEISTEQANFAILRKPRKWVYTAPAKSFPPNGYGLYNVLGNAWEWVHDWRGENYYAKSPVKDPQGPASGELRSVRGGGWTHFEPSLRLSNRGWGEPQVRYFSFGFRCMRETFP